MNAVVHIFLLMTTVFVWWSVLSPRSFIRRFPSCSRWLGVSPRRPHRPDWPWLLRATVAAAITVFACFVWTAGITFVP